MNNLTSILNDAELAFVTGGAFLTPVKSETQQIAEKLTALYKANHPIELGPFAPIRTAVPRF